MAQVKGKPVYPIPIVSSVSLDNIQPKFQGNTDACTAFAAAHAYMVQMKLMEQEVDIDPLYLYRKVFEKKGSVYDPNKSVSFKEVFEVMKDEGMIKRWREIDTTPEDFKIKIYQLYVPMCEINAPRLLHSVCVPKYDHDDFVYYDSNSKYRPRKVLPSFEYINKAYILTPTSWKV